MHEELLLPGESCHRTGYDKVFVARNGVRPVLRRETVMRLISAAEDGDRAQVRCYLAELLPGLSAKGNGGAGRRQADVREPSIPIRENAEPARDRAPPQVVREPRAGTVGVDS